MKQNWPKYAVMVLIAVLIAAGVFGAVFERVLASEAQASSTAQSVLDVPSGQPVVFLDRVLSAPDHAATARFRFVAPELADRVESLSYADLEADLAFLCDSYALPLLDGSARPETVVISLSEAPVEFGATQPEITQVFEAYKLTETGCIWEAF